MHIYLFRYEMKIYFIKYIKSIKKEIFCCAIRFSSDKQNKILNRDISVLHSIYTRPHYFAPSVTYFHSHIIINFFLRLSTQSIRRI